MSVDKSRLWFPSVLRNEAKGLLYIVNVNDPYHHSRSMAASPRVAQTTK